MRHFRMSANEGIGIEARPGSITVTATIALRGRFALGCDPSSVIAHIPEDGMYAPPGEVEPRQILRPPRRAQNDKHG